MPQALSGQALLRSRLATTFFAHILWFTQAADVACAAYFICGLCTSHKNIVAHRSGLMIIKDEQPNDSNRITHIHYNAFKGHPMHAPGAEPTEHIIVERLRASKALTLSLLAEDDGEAVGHIAISPATVGESENGWYFLGPVGVVPSHQGRGIGSSLIREALQRMKDKGAGGIVLVGEPKFYNQFGFRNIEGITYQGVPDQYVLALPFTESVPKGDIIAHNAFSVSSS